MLGLGCLCRLWRRHAGLGSRVGPLVRRQRRIRPVHEQREIVVALEDERIDTREHALDVRRRRTGIGEQPEPAVPVAEKELRGLARIVRHRIGMNLEVADHER